MKEDFVTWGEGLGRSQESGLGLWLGYWADGAADHQEGGEAGGGDEENRLRWVRRGSEGEWGLLPPR